MFTYIFGFFSGMIATFCILIVIFFTLYIARKDYREAINKFVLAWYNRYKKWKSDRELKRSYRIRLWK
jgi:succinate dehydrogenase hydrophobic anchor subunit